MRKKRDFPLVNRKDIKMSEVNKVVVGDKTLIDLTNDTVTPEDMLNGVIAHDASGKKIIGTGFKGLESIIFGFPNTPVNNITNFWFKIATVTLDKNYLDVNATLLVELLYANNGNIAGILKCAVRTQAVGNSNYIQDSLIDVFWLVQSKVPLGSGEPEFKVIVDRPNNTGAATASIWGKCSMGYQVVKVSILSNCDRLNYSTSKENVRIFEFVDAIDTDNAQPLPTAQTNRWIKDASYAYLMNPSQHPAMFAEHDPRTDGTPLVGADTDWNTLIKNGSYKVQSATMDKGHNAPVGEYSYGIIFCIYTEHPGSIRIVQLYIPHQPLLYRMWVRIANGGSVDQLTWLDWHAFASDGFPITKNKVNRNTKDANDLLEMNRFSIEELTNTSTNTPYSGTYNYIMNMQGSDKNYGVQIGIPENQSAYRPPDLLTRRKNAGNWNSWASVSKGFMMIYGTNANIVDTEKVWYEIAETSFDTGGHVRNIVLLFTLPYNNKSKKWLGILECNCRSASATDLSHLELTWRLFSSSEGVDQTINPTEDFLAVKTSTATTVKVTIWAKQSRPWTGVQVKALQDGSGGDGDVYQNFWWFVNWPKNSSGKPKPTGNITYPTMSKVLNPAADSDMVGGLVPALLYKTHNGNTTGNLDWNTLVDSGVYKIQNCTMTEAYHAPVGAYPFGTLVVLFTAQDMNSDTGEKRCVQIYVTDGFAAADSNLITGLWIRAGNGNNSVTWRPWYRLWDPNASGGGGGSSEIPDPLEVKEVMFKNSSGKKTGVIKGNNQTNSSGTGLSIIYGSDNTTGEGFVIMNDSPASDDSALVMGNPDGFANKSSIYNSGVFSWPSKALTALKGMATDRNGTDSLSDSSVQECFNVMSAYNGRYLSVGIDCGKKAGWKAITITASYRSSTYGVNLLDLCAEYGLEVKWGTAYKPISASAFNVSSSIRFKENVLNMTEEEALKILQLRVVTFDYKEEYGGKKDCEGLIAEEVIDVDPFHVTTEDWEEDKRPASIDYSTFVPKLIKMVQIQDQKIKSLEQELEEMKLQLLKMEAKILNL